MNSNPSPAPPAAPDPASAASSGAGKKAKRGSAWRWGAYIGGFLLLVIGALALLAEFFLSQADEYRPRIEEWVSRIAGESIEFEAIRIHRRGFLLAIELDDLRVAEGAKKPASRGAAPDTALAPPILDERLRLDSITFVIDPIRTLLDATPRVHGIALDGLAFPIARPAAGEILIAGHRLPTRPSTSVRDTDSGIGDRAQDRDFASSLEPLMAWLAGQQDLTFDNTVITLRKEGGDLPLFFERIRIERKGIEHDSPLTQASTQASTSAPIADVGAWRIVGTVFPLTSIRAGDENMRGSAARGKVDFSANLHGDSLSSWSAQVEARASALRLESLRRFAIPGQGEQMSDEGGGERRHIAGELSGEALASVRNFDLLQSQGKLSLRSLRLASIDADTAGSSPSSSPRREGSFPQRIEGSFSFEREESGWRAFLGDISFDAKDAWALDSLELRLSVPAVEDARSGEKSDPERGEGEAARISGSLEGDSDSASPKTLQPEFSLLADRMRVADLLSVAAYLGGDPEVFARIEGLGIEGRLDDIRLRWPALDSSAQESPSPSKATSGLGLRASASFDGIGIPGSKAALSPRGFEGRLELDPLGKIVARIEDGEMAFSSDYRTPVLEPLRDFSGTLTYTPHSIGGGEDAAPSIDTPEHRPSEGGLVISELSAQSIAGRLRAEGELRLPDEGDPGMPFRFRLELDDADKEGRGGASLEAVRALLPRRAVPAPVDRWIDSAMPEGDVASARLAIEGRLSATVASERASEEDDAKTPGSSEPASAIAFTLEDRDVEATVELSLPDFAYAARWPPLSDIVGQVRFVNARMEARIHKGGIFGSTLRKTDVVIENMGASEPMLAISGGVDGPIADGMRYLSESPLRENFMRLSKSLAFDGEGSVLLDIEVPLGRARKTRKTKARGEIRLARSGADIRGFEEGLQGIEGSIFFDGNRIDADDLRANYLGRGIRIAIDDTTARETRGSDEPSDRSPDGLDGLGSDGQRILRIAFAGHSPPDHLLSHLRNIGASLPDIFRAKDDPNSIESAKRSEKAHWQATLDIPRSMVADERTPLGARLRLRSDLAGLGLDLPEPFGKDAQSIRRFSLDDRFTVGQAHDLHLHYGDRARARFLLSSTDAGLAIERGDILLGRKARSDLSDLPSRLEPAPRADADRKPPSDSGIRIEGDLPVLDLARWQGLLASMGADLFAGGSAGESAKGFAKEPAGSVEALPAADDISSNEPDTAFALDAIEEVDLDIGRLFLDRSHRPLSGVHLHFLPVEKEPDTREWRIALESEHIKGWIGLVDADRPRRRIRAEFERLILAADDAAESEASPLELLPHEPESGDAGTEEGAPLSPPDLPPTELLIRQLVWGDIDFGAVDVSTSLLDDGVQFRHLRIRNPDFELDGIGSWKIESGEIRSEFAGKLRGEDLGRIIDRIGLDGRVAERGKSELTFHGFWTGSPIDLELEEIGGVLSLRSGPGSLRNLDRGLFARFFSLLILESLPRRLLFDFDDLFGQGLDYDRLVGEFRISGGSARTGDLTIESETVRLTVTGRIGLVEENYDLVVTLVPKITSALPLTPLRVGEGILGSEIINRFFSYRYSIRGGWDDPIIEPMQ
ncbi:MAG: hypothetical protein ISN28_04260 [Ectothiorhodospiraceae bacterium AqS1]|nr:hypothetical protein [Ectothiorhodospiraceae bacterium AqS1]